MIIVLKAIYYCRYLLFISYVFILLSNCRELSYSNCYSFYFFKKMLLFDNERYPFTLCVSLCLEFSYYVY